MTKRSLYTVVVVLSLVLIASCSQETNRSESPVPPPLNRASGANISQIFGDTAENPQADSGAQPMSISSQAKSNNAQINTSRQTAITRAVQKVSPAVVSITITETVQGGRRLAFDEFYNRFLSG